MTARLHSNLQAHRYDRVQLARRNDAMRYPRFQSVAVWLLYGRQAWLDSELDFVFEIGSGTGIRTLNLAVKRSLHPDQKWHPEFAE
jgi:hypothetical protein